MLTENVAKEMRKDALVVRCAAQSLAADTVPGEGDVGRLLAEAREIDRQFLARAGALPLRLEVPYARIEPLRRRRIALGLELARLILAGWQDGGRLRDVLPVLDFEQRLRAVLTLYCEETAELARGVRASGTLFALRERAAGRLFESMTEVATQLARDASRAVHRARIAAQKSG